MPIRCTGDPIYPEPVILPGSDGIRIGTKQCETLRRTPTEKVYRNIGVLQNFPTSFIDTQAVRRLDKHGRLWVLDVIEDELTFLSHVTGDLPTVAHVSRFMSQHEEKMLSAGILSRSDEFAKIVMALFTTPKKDATLRLIQDDRPLNAVFDKPPDMNLPRLHQFIDFILEHNYMAQADAKSYFYQFLLAKDVQKYFGVRLAHGRGPLKEFLFTRLAMGFSWAPAIAQRVSNAIVDGLGIVWVDNFVIVGKTKEEFTRNREEFLRRIDECNLELDDRSLEGTIMSEAIGLEFNLKEKSYRMSPKWVELTCRKLRVLLSVADITCRDFYAVMGAVIWHRHAMKLPLCSLPHTFQFLGSTASALAQAADWDSKISVPHEVLRELLVSLDELELNKPRKKSDPVSIEATVWTDASSKYYAWLAEMQGIVLASNQGETPEQQHIFYSELHSAIEGIIATDLALRMEKKGGGIRVQIDNAPAASCLQKRVSTNYVANQWLRRLPDRPIVVNWIPTETMKTHGVDRYTRVNEATQTVPKIPAVGDPWTPYGNV